MADIVGRLRATGGKGQGGPIKAEAAAEIEQLRAQVGALNGDVWKLGDQVQQASEIILDLLGLELGSSERGMAFLETLGKSPLSSTESQEG